MRRATGCYFNSELNLFDISIHALREESDAIMSVIDSNKFNISIHALREESDELLYNDKFKINISIHALREESDIMRCWKYTTKKAFQSTLSVRRATFIKLIYLVFITGFQSTLSVRRATESKRLYK